MPSTIGFDFGDVLLVPFPFTDQSTTKKRPAVVVSSAAYNRERPDVILMAITSQVRSSNVIGDVSIQRWKEAGLLKRSVIKAVVTTIEKTLVLKKLGRLDDRDARARPNDSHRLRRLILGEGDLTSVWPAGSRGARTASRS